MNRTSSESACRQKVRARSRGLSPHAWRTLEHGRNVRSGNPALVVDGARSSRLATPRRARFALHSRPLPFPPRGGARRRDSPSRRSRKPRHGRSPPSAFPAPSTTLRPAPSCVRRSGASPAARGPHRCHTAEQRDGAAPLGEGRADDDRHRTLRHDLSQEGQAIHARHLQIEHDHVGALFGHLLERDDRILRRDHLHAFASEDLGENPANDGGIIDNENVQRSAHGCRRRRVSAEESPGRASARRASRRSRVASMDGGRTRVGKKEPRSHLRSLVLSYGDAECSEKLRLQQTKSPIDRLRPSKTAGGAPGRWDEVADCPAWRELLPSRTCTAGGACGGG